MLKIKNFYIFILVTSAIWGSTLQFFYIPGVGSVYPLRIILIFFFIYGLLNLFAGGGYIDKTSFRSMTNIRLWVFWLWILILTIIRTKTANTNSAFVTYTMNLLLIACVPASLKDEEDERIALKTIIFNSIFQGVLATYESVMGIWLFRSNALSKWDMNSYGMVTPVTIFYNTNNLCMFIVLSLPAFFMLFKNTIVRILYFLFVICISILTSCRTGLASAILFVLIILSIRVIKDGRVKVCVFFVFVLAALVYVARDNILLTNERLLLWGNTLYNCYLDKFIGVGTGNAIVSISGNIMNIVYSAYGNVIYAVHNYLFELLLETGIVGVVIVGTWFISVFKKVWNYRIADRGMYYFITIILLCLTSICVSTMTDFFQYWLYLGLLVAYVSNKETDKDFDII